MPSAPLPDSQPAGEPEAVSGAEDLRSRTASLSVEEAAVLHRASLAQALRTDSSSSGSSVALSTTW